jgi:nucleotide-binding universal stress UspA family protein
MIKILVAVDADLASSIALRYACQLASLMEVELQTIHVKEPELEGPATGAGWARRTWEKELLRKGKSEIAQLLKAESSSCPVLSEPLISVGDRDEEILHELQQGGYDLFVEGFPSLSTSSHLYQKMHSRLYQHIPCPFIMVKNLVSLRKVLLLLADEIDTQRLLSAFFKVFGGARLEADLVFCGFQQSGKQVSQREKEWDAGIQSAQASLAAEGWSPQESRVLRGTPEELSAYFEDYEGLVVAAPDRGMGKKSQVLALLGLVPSPIFLC